MATCSTCAYFAPLSPGHAAICFERWRHLPWNAAVPLTTADDGCENHIPRRLDNGDTTQGAVESHDPQDSVPAGRPT